jgi:ATP-dependent RNA helicase DDX60
MDLEEFDDSGLTLPVHDTPSSFSAKSSLDHVDREWYANASRRARWMDLLGDYAGSEAFVIDGMFQLTFHDLNLRFTEIL